MSRSYQEISYLHLENIYQLDTGRIVKSPDQPVILLKLSVKLPMCRTSVRNEVHTLMEICFSAAFQQKRVTVSGE